MFPGDDCDDDIDTDNIFAKFVMGDDQIDTDANDQTTFYEDSDEDGFGNAHHLWLQQDLSAILLTVTMKIKI